MKDKRTEKTLNLIRNSYLKLSKLKPVHKITVKDICDDANINRGTFYRYYRDVPELKEHLETEAAKRFVSAIVSEYKSTHTATRAGQSVSGAEGLSGRRLPVVPEH